MAVMIPVGGGRTTWNLNFKDELCVSCALCQVYSEGSDFSLRRTFFFSAVPIMHRRGLGGQKLKQIHRIAGLRTAVLCACCRKRVKALRMKVTELTGEAGNL